MGRLVVFSLILLVGAGCASSPPTPSETPRAPYSVPTPFVVPSPIAEEIARDVWNDGSRTTTGGKVDLQGERWVASGQCVGGGDLAATYRLSVDGKEVSSGTIICSTGITYTNSAIQPTRGKHDVRVVFGPEVENALSAYVRVIPERLAGQ
ncbi:MAG: hypothetical protein QM582_01780 [Micropruina sp.]|uniref:hypothetical protein n=1 Tax=Micropruina sp. TaxID=2737536 RepID=UPI0039E5EFD5